MMDLLLQGMPRRSLLIALGIAFVMLFALRLRAFWHHWEEVVAELNLACTPDLHILDGTRLMVEGGPWAGKTVNANLIIVTGDRVAADLVGLAVLKHYSELPLIKDVDVWEQRQVKRAIELGLGVKGEDEIELMEKDLAPEITAFEGVLKAIRKEVLREDAE